MNWRAWNSALPVQARNSTHAAIISMISVNLIPGFMAYINQVAPHGLEIACSGIFIVGQFDHPKGTFFYRTQLQLQLLLLNAIFDSWQAIYFFVNSLKSICCDEVLTERGFCMLTSKYQRYEDYRRGNTNLGRVAPLSLPVLYFILGTKRHPWVHQRQQTCGPNKCSYINLCKVAFIQLVIRAT
jgi:hypothetical protein